MFEDFQAMAAAARGRDQDCLKLTQSPFRGTLTMAHTPELRVGYATWSGGILSTGAVPRGARSFAIVASDTGPARLRGEAVGASDLATQTDREELHVHHPRGCAMLVASFGHDLLDQVTKTFLGAAWGDAVGDRHLVRLRDASAATAAPDWEVLPFRRVRRRLPPAVRRGAVPDAAA